MEHFITPISAALFGWLAFNVILFRVAKDEYDDQDKTFPIKKYFSYVWDNWLASLVMIPVLLYIGGRGLGITFDGNNLAWNDAYYPASGFITELVIVAWKKWKNKNKLT